jgi:signal transduction histidine kinase
LLGAVLAVCGLTVAAIARYRSFGYAEAVARACHELRGPLTAVRLGLELAFRSGQLPDERVRALDLELGRATLALDDLSEAWQRGPVVGWPQAVEQQEIDVTRLLADSVEALRGAAAAHGVELRLMSSGSHAVVSGERLRLAQATGNLIANAIEHGGGVVDITWRVERSTIRIEVIDGGVGLPAPVAELVRAGRQRHQVWGSGRRGSGRWGSGAWGSGRWGSGAWGYGAWGSGVLPGRRRVTRRGHGLAIASAIAAAHGGRLAAAPSERGARLVLELPVAGPSPVSTSAGG